MDGDRIIPIETRYIELMFDELLMYETFSLWVKIDSTEICVCSSYIATDATLYFNILWTNVWNGCFSYVQQRHSCV